MESIIESVEQKHAFAVRMREHEAIVAAALAEAGNVQLVPSSPVMPVQVHIAEALAAAKAAEQHRPALEGAGMDPGLPHRVERSATALRSGEALWQACRRASCGGQLEELLAEGRKERGYVSAASILALRKHPEGLRRLAAVVHGDDPREVSSNLADLGLILTDYAAQFAAIRVDVEATATRLGELAAQILEAALDEAGVQALARAKEVRDRLYTLTLEPLAELRAFAQFALRDAPPEVREKFSSQYAREKRRRFARQAKAPRPAAPAANDTPEVDEADVSAEVIAKVA